MLPTSFQAVRKILFKCQYQRCLPSFLLRGFFKASLFWVCFQGRFMYSGNDWFFFWYLSIHFFFPSSVTLSEILLMVVCEGNHCLKLVTGYLTPSCFCLLFFFSLVKLPIYVSVIFCQLWSAFILFHLIFVIILSGNSSRVILLLFRITTTEYSPVQ